MFVVYVIDILLSSFYEVFIEESYTGIVILLILAHTMGVFMLLPQTDGVNRFGNFLFLRWTRCGR